MRIVAVSTAARRGGGRANVIKATCSVVAKRSEYATESPDTKHALSLSEISPTVHSELVSLNVVANDRGGNEEIACTCSLTRTLTRVFKLRPTGEVSSTP